ncbi:MAG: hypothetical protein ACTSV0_08500 [Candidatus Freyarchaeota archaeon]
MDNRPRGREPSNPPLKRTGQDTLVDAEGKKHRLFKGVRKLLKHLREKGILLSIASSNRHEPNMVEECLRKPELDFFVYPQVNRRDKGGEREKPSYAK